jgi:hypothetical protein
MEEESKMPATSKRSSASPQGAHNSTVNARQPTINTYAAVKRSKQSNSPAMRSTIQQATFAATEDALEESYNSETDNLLAAMGDHRPTQSTAQLMTIALGSSVTIPPVAESTVTPAIAEPAQVEPEPITPVFTQIDPALTPITLDIEELSDAVPGGSGLG